MAKTNDAAVAFYGSESYHDKKLIYPAATRNKEPILQLLKKYLTNYTNEIQDSSPLFLEIGSGSGQHVAHFATHFPTVKFQPSELDKNLFGSITYYSLNCSTKNVMQPVFVDICKELSCYGFRENSIDYIYCANVMHISPYECTIGLFKNAGIYLKSEALMITYGPFSKDGIITPESNVEFDASLRSRNPQWGLRDISELVKLANKNLLSLVETVDMPSNNKTLIWKKL